MFLNMRRETHIEYIRILHATYFNLISSTTRRMVSSKLKWSPGIVTHTLWHFRVEYRVEQSISGYTFVDRVLPRGKRVVEFCALDSAPSVILGVFDDQDGWDTAPSVMHVPQINSKYIIIWTRH